jgi:hypothetical protein
MTYFVLLLLPLILCFKEAFIHWVSEPIDLVAWLATLGWTVSTILIAIVMLAAIFWN